MKRDPATLEGKHESMLRRPQTPDRDAETLAYLSVVLTGFSLLMNFVLQKLGLVLAERELAKLKETTLLKQVILKPMNTSHMLALLDITWALHPSWLLHTSWTLFDNWGVELFGLILLSAGILRGQITLLQSEDSNPIQFMSQK